MERVSTSYLQRWWIPLACGLTFLLLLTLVIPYSTSLWSVKRPLFFLIVGLSGLKNSSVDSTYCLFVPPIFAYLVYLRHKDIAKAHIQGSNVALVAIIFGVVLYLFGMRAGDQYFGYAAVQILLAGVIIWLWGWAVFRLVLFPWAFFIFAWPVPFLDPILSFPLRMIISTTASHLLPYIGVPCLQNGTALISPSDPIHGLAQGARYEIDIADPCSGIRSLFALVMFSALFAYLFVPRLWQQWIIFVSAVPLAMLGNLVRIIQLVLGSIWFGSAFAVGTNDEPSTYHEGCGYLIYGVALGAEFGLASLLTREWCKSRATPPETQKATA